MDGARPLPAPTGTRLGGAASGGGPMVGSSLPGLLGALQTAHGPSGTCRACTKRPLVRGTQSWRRESRPDPATSAASRSARWWRQRFKEEPAAGSGQPEVPQKGLCARHCPPRWRSWPAPWLWPTRPLPSVKEGRMWTSLSRATRWLLPSPRPPGSSGVNEGPVSPWVSCLPVD